MKTHMITFITAVLLIMAYVEIYGQIPQNPPKFNSKQEEYEYYCGQKKELTKQCQELKRQADVENEARNDLKIAENYSDKGARLADEGKNEDASCNAGIAFDGGMCLGVDQEMEIIDNQENDDKKVGAKISMAQKRQIKENIQYYIKAVSKYNEIAEKYNKAHLENANNRNDLAYQVGSAINNARGYVYKLASDANVNPTLTNIIVKADDTMEKWNDDGTKNLVDDLESLRSYTSCDDCFINK